VTRPAACNERPLTRLFGALVLVLGIVSSAAADPVVDRVSTEIRKRRTLRVQVEATLATPGEVLLEGTINGRPVALRRRVRRAGSRRVRFRVNPRKFGVRRPTDDLVFDLEVVVRERDGPEATRAVQARIPVPVVLLPGLGNELPDDQLDVQTMDAFAALLDAGRGGIYDLEGRRPDLIVHGYRSLEQSLPSLAKELHRRVRKVLKGSAFRRVDVVGYSMGGLVARAWSADRGRGRVRRMVLVGTPNEGVPLAYVVTLLTPETLSGLLDSGDAGGLTGFLDVLLTDESRETLRIFYPTYAWVESPFGDTNPAAAEAPLMALNATDPDPDADFHAVGYTDVAGEDLGVPLNTFETLDFLSLAALLGGGGDLDLAQLADGSGDLVVPARSAFMSDVPHWAARLTTYDMGAGTHFTLLTDPAVLARIVAILDAR